MRLRFEAVRGHIEAFDEDTGQFLFSADKYSEALEEASLYRDEPLARNFQMSAKAELFRDNTNEEVVS